MDGVVLSGYPTAPRRVSSPLLVPKPQFTFAGSERLTEMRSKGKHRIGDG